ncbi:hypothetical protein RN001_009891 [Aquatica leii]|uniref:Uncharacterized protein n=1 Tax=Aquatica leii TaxID=1421715 RepID=A0AAN7Q2T7_9COLE|nr:hypothetical protein RN001_009891 [Aquatica leii]
MRVIIVVLFCILCEVISVPKQPPCATLQLKHGRVRYRTRNRFVKFMCNPGYILAGGKYSTCENGAWDGPPPKCVRPSCVKVQAPPNIIIYPSHRGGVLNFFYKPGFALRGDNITYCDGNNWDNRLPTCIVTTTLKAPTATVKQFISPGTIKRVFAGYYMYIESLSRNENDTARLISPIYDKINDSNVCFEFYYYMYGSTTGQLRLNPNTAFFWKIGNYGNVWIRSWHIIIEGVRGKSYYNDIAIDDVRIIPDCVDSVTTERDNLYSFDDDTILSCLNRYDTPPNPNVSPSINNPGTLTSSRGDTPTSTRMGAPTSRNESPAPRKRARKTPAKVKD